jgi:hypothetical protein
MTLGSPWAQWQVGNYVRTLSRLLVAAAHIMWAGTVTAFTCDVYRRTPSVEGLQQRRLQGSPAVHARVVLVRI